MDVMYLYYSSLRQQSYKVFSNEETHCGEGTETLEKKKHIIVSIAIHNHCMDIILPTSSFSKECYNRSLNIVLYINKELSLFLFWG